MAGGKKVGGNQNVSLDHLLVTFPVDVTCEREREWVREGGEGERQRERGEREREREGEEREGERGNLHGWGKVGGNTGAGTAVWKNKMSA